MTYKLEPPFEIYHDGTQIADKNGRICTAENPDIARAILWALQILEAALTSQERTLTGE